MPIGTFINIVAVVIGGVVGLLLNKNFPQKIQQIVFQGIGLCTLLIGMQMALQVKDPLILIFSILIGGILGEITRLEDRIENLSNMLKKRVGSQDEGFTQGLVTAFLIFCIGSMTIVGALNEGISGDRSLLLTKSVLDGFTSIALASTYGIGVLFSVIPMLIFQGGLTVFASQFSDLFSQSLLLQLTATGGILILGIGINLLEIKKIKVVNLLPSLLVAVLLTVLLLK
ncbi:MAG TPA: DUF554 domain-containing protein [Vitreimonas sp.]|nr:DUF554 domain-containing protein [Vitreimonas sp.]